MKNIFCFWGIFLSFFLSSCGSYYYCNVNAFGTIPNEKSYYIIPADSTLKGDLEFHEYSNILKNRLNEIGYYEANQNDAKLCIEFSYYYGEEKELETTTTTSTSSFTNSKQKLESKTNSSANASAQTNFWDKLSAEVNAKSNTNANLKATQQNFSNTSTTTRTRYEIPVGCFILVKDNQTSNKIWQVEVKDNIPDYYAENTSLHSLMPWMILSAQEYFGISGESQVKIDKKEGVENKGLKWPYRF